jgi:GNAT superfamily N-acetyltransferase
MAPPAVRRFEAHEWRTLRELRLRALGDAPDAFSKMLAEELGRSDSEWEAMLASTTGSPSAISLLAEQEGRPVGLAYGQLEPGAPEIAHLFSMWVDPSARRSGVGRALVLAVVAWARSAKARRLVLRVTEGNAAAVSLYERVGFASTNQLAPLRPGSALEVRTMRLELEPRGPDPRYTIALARPRDLSALREIELAAAALLEGHAPPAVLAETTGEDDLREAQAAGRLWVALGADGAPVGFALVELLPSGEPHLQELGVHPRHGRRGIGAELVRAVCDWTARSRHAALTLTTFRDVAWNLPFYSRLGFAEIPPDELRDELVARVRGEAARGLDPARRAVMAWVPRPAAGRA